MHPVGFPNLQVMPAGPLPPNPPELLDSKAMESLQMTLANSGAEVIIFDAPPMLGLSDASILAPKVDGILLVVDIERANKKQIEHMKTLLAQSGGKVLGCVVNKQHRKRKDTSYYSYYYSSSEGESKSAQNSHHPVAVAASTIPNSASQH